MLHKVLRVSLHAEHFHVTVYIGIDIIRQAWFYTHIVPVGFFRFVEYACYECNLCIGVISKKDRKYRDHPILKNSFAIYDSNFIVKH